MWAWTTCSPSNSRGSRDPCQCGICIDDLIVAEKVPKASLKTEDPAPKPRQVLKEMRTKYQEVLRRSDAKAFENEVLMTWQQLRTPLTACANCT